MNLTKLLSAVLIVYGLIRILLARTALWRLLIPHPSRVKTMLAALCWLVLGLSFAAGIYAAAAEHIFSFDEASVLAVAANYAHGGVMYPPHDAPAEYGLLYGPATYLVYLPPILLHADRIGLYHGWVLLALLAAHWLLYKTARRTMGGRLEGLAGVAGFAMLLCHSLTNEWWIKADAWILLASAAGLWAAVTQGRWLASAAIAVTGAMLVNLKFPLLPLALLPCAVLWSGNRKNRLPAVLAVGLIPLLSFLPFCLPGISLGNYLELLREAGKHGYSLVVFETNLPTFVLLLLLPAAMIAAAWRLDRQETLAWTRRRAPFLCLLGAAVPTAILMGAKNGGGPWHALVLAVPIVFLCGELWKRIADATPSLTPNLIPALAPVLALGVVMFGSSPRAILAEARDREPVDAPPRALQAELKRILREHPGTSLQMGYTDGAHMADTFARPLLQVAGSPLFLDAIARNEATMTDRPMSPAVYGALDRCVYGLWILPKRGEPFSLDSYYYLGHAIDKPEMYPIQFQEAFKREYIRLPSDYVYFDLWGCRP